MLDSLKRHERLDVRLTHTVASLIVSTVALIAAAVVQVAAGGDPTPYIGVATGALGYAAGNTVRGKSK